MLEFHTDPDRFQYDVGVDEVGRGCLCGPVLAAAVVLPSAERIREPSNAVQWARVKDSKKLTEKSRTELSRFIRDQCIYGFGWIHPADIDRLNILQATMKAMHTALDECFRHPYWDASHTAPHRVKIRIDGNHFRPYMPPGEDTESRWVLSPECVVEGDNTYLAIAAASIIAKHERDTYMKQLVVAEPALDVYGLSKNKGYGTKVHLEALQNHGITPHHRQSFRPVREAGAAHEVREAGVAHD